MTLKHLAMMAVLAGVVAWAAGTASADLADLTLSDSQLVDNAGPAEILSGTSTAQDIILQPHSVGDTGGSGGGAEVPAHAPSPGAVGLGAIGLTMVGLVRRRER